MEYCSHGSLLNALNDDSMTLTWDRLLQWTEDALMGIQVLHSSNPSIVHKNIKSCNFLLDNLRVKISDFGLWGTDTTNIASYDPLKRTLAYWAPEIYLGTAFSPKSDMYSMGNQDVLIDY